MESIPVARDWAVEEVRTELAVFTNHGDGRVTVDRFPQRMAFARELLEDCRPACFEVEGEYVRITVANGQALYRMVARDADGRTVVAERAWARMEAA